MFKRRKKKVKIKHEIDGLLSEMSRWAPHEPEYGIMAENLERLYKTKESKKSYVSGDTVVTVAGSIAGIALVLYFEKAGIVTSKAFNLILKGRV